MDRIAAARSVARCRAAIVCAICMVGAHIGAGASRIDGLIQALAGDDEAARVEARQLLPREGGAAAARLIPLLSHERQEVWRTAFNVLADIAHDVSAPGRESERIEVADNLMRLVSPETPPHAKELGLRLLPIALPEGYDVSPVAALLRDPEFREKARAALELTGTAPARTALRDALENADPAFQCALLNSLAIVQDEAGLSVIEGYTRHSDERVRAAAARALAWTGRPRYLASLRRVHEEAGPATAFETGDALVRLADRMVHRGGNWEIAMGIYRGLLASSDIRLKNAAVAGLGRFGDETAVPDILTALAGEQGDALEPAALAAFRSLAGRAARIALRDSYPAFSHEMRVCLLGVFGDARDAVFLDVLTEAAGSADDSIRVAALDALAASELPEALPMLIAAADKAAPEQRERSVERVRHVAEAYRNRGMKNVAGKALLALFRLAANDEERAWALEGIKENPTPEAFDVLLSQLDESELAALPAPVLLGVAKVLVDAGRPEDAAGLFDATLPKLDSTDAIEETIEYLRGTSGAAEISRRLGFVTRWMLVGPFPWSPPDSFTRRYINEPDVDLVAEYAVNEEPLRWQVHETEDVGGIVDLMSLYGEKSNAVAFGLARIHVDQDTDAVIRAGSDDGIKIWVNGDVVHENDVDRPSALDQDLATARFRSGSNVLLTAVTQHGGGWNFRVRLTRPDGTPLPFTYTE